MRKRGYPVGIRQGAKVAGLDLIGGSLEGDGPLNKSPLPRIRDQHADGAARVGHAGGIL